MPKDHKIFIPQSEYDSLERLAKARNMTVEEFVNDLIEQRTRTAPIEKGPRF
jgi:predicted DNA-binding ribbon-helix-helix protein